MAGCGTARWPRSATRATRPCAAASSSCSTTPRWSPTSWSPCAAPSTAGRGSAAISNTLVLQDPEVRKDFAWDPGWVGKITAPTLLLWTDHDPTGGLDEAAMLLDWLPDARLYVIADAGHWPQWEKPAEYLRVHRDFLLRRRRPGAGPAP